MEEQKKHKRRSNKIVVTVKRAGNDEAAIKAEARRTLKKEKAVAKSRAFQNRIRFGKTKKDHERGVQRRNAENKERRVDWQKDSKRTQANFPYHTCNGKRNRTQWTGKNGRTVRVEWTGMK